MIEKNDFDALRVELSVKSKNGVDFILAAAIVWSVVAFIWMLEMTPYNKAVLTFIVSGVLLPLAFLFSKILKTNWSNKSNPLQPLGLWLNFAQLFYFPFLIFILLKSPTYFVMTYAIITGAHFFPYAWFYKTSVYAGFAAVISVGALVMGLKLPEEQMYAIPAFVAGSLFIQGTLLYFEARKKVSVSSI